MRRGLFILIVTLGLAINLYGDWQLLKLNNEEIESGRWIQSSNEFKHSLDSFRIFLLQSAKNEFFDSEVSKRLAHLQDLNKDDKDLPQQLKQIYLLLQKPSNPSDLRTTLSLLEEWSKKEKIRIESRTEKDFQISQEVLRKSQICNVLDAALIFIFVGFYFYERKSAFKLQSAMVKTLSDVEVSNQRLHEALDEKNSQIKITVHDLKNPLGSIRGFAEILKLSPGDPSSVLKMSDLIQKVSNNTLTLVNSLLADRQKLRPQAQVDVVNCLDETCQFLKPMALEKKQTLQVLKNQCLIQISAEKQRLFDVFFNLISNALKFSPPGSDIKIVCEGLSSGARILILDQGPGFAPEDFPRLFTSGVSLSAKPTGNETSTGIGLFSVKKALDELGVGIQVSNALGGGACIELIFPRT